MARFFGRDKEGDGGAEQSGAYPADGQATQPREQPTTEQPTREEGYERDHGQPSQEQPTRAQETEARDQPNDAAVTSEAPPEDDPEYKRRLEASHREGNSDDEYQWHTGPQRPTGVADAVEFVEVHKAFGRNQILRGLNMGIPEGKISMILGPSGTGKSVCIKHMVGLLYPDDGDVLVHGESVPNMPDDDLFEMRKKFGVLFQDGALFGSMN